MSLVFRDYVFKETYLSYSDAYRATMIRGSRLSENRLAQYWIRYWRQHGLLENLEKIKADRLD